MPQPEYWTSHSGKVAVKLNMQPGDQAIVALHSPEASKGVSVFMYPDHTVTIVGCQSKDETILMLEKAVQTLRAIPVVANLAPQEGS